MPDSENVRELKDYRNARSAAPKAAHASHSGGGGGIYDGMDERVGKLEVRAEFVERRLESIDGKLDRLEAAVRDIAVTLARLPSKEFLIATVIAALGIAIAVAALTFNIADYAAKTTQQAEQAKAAQPTSTPQPIIITLPPPSMNPVLPAVPQPLPSQQPAAPRSP